MPPYYCYAAVKLSVVMWSVVMLSVVLSQFDVFFIEIDIQYSDQQIQITR